MSRRRHLKTQPAVNLLPFMAVLICTMGTLIVLLVVIVQEARDTANAPPIVPAAVAAQVVAAAPIVLPPPAPPVADPQWVQELEDLQWANELLVKSREETLRDLEERRGDLSRIEDQVRSLNEKLDLLTKESESFFAAKANRFSPEANANVELEQVRLAVAEKEELLAAKQSQVSKNRHRYSLIPYDGPNGTRRRPIYVECTADGVVLQPEGVRFGGDDFLNYAASAPLPAALRAYREYLSEARLIESGGEPYPLIVARPGGEHFFNACRAMMRSWDDELGYELIPAEMELAFPAPDPAIAALLQNVVAQAREQASSQIASLQRGFVEDRTGTPLPPGVVAAGGRYKPTGVRLDNSPEGSAPTFSIGSGEGGGLIANNSSPASSARRQSQSGTSSRRRELMKGIARSGGGGRQVAKQGSARADAMSITEGNATAYGSPSANAPLGQKFAAGSVGGSVAHGDPSTSAAAPANVAASPSTTGDGSSVAGVAGGASMAGGAGGSGKAGGSGEAGSKGQTAPVGFSASSNPTEAEAATVSFERSFAETRGANWALPNAANGSIGITRPIAVVCERQQIILKTDRGDVAIPIVGDSVSDSIQPMVMKVWSVIEDWGIAGPGVYWKPTMHILVQPGAERVYSNLKSVLQDSGLDIKRR